MFSSEFLKRARSDASDILHRTGDACRLTPTVVRVILNEAVGLPL
jgi:hypothetical protein